jgi:hypothetical protein
MLPQSRFMKQPTFPTPHSPISPISQAAPQGAVANPTYFSSPAAKQAQAQPAQNASVDDLARIFNTVLVSSLAQEESDFPGEFCKLMESPAFRAILAAIQQHARAEGSTVRQATEQVIQTFRKMDSLWRSYIYREGLDKIGSADAVS